MNRRSILKGLFSLPFLSKAVTDIPFKAPTEVIPELPIANVPKRARLLGTVVRTVPRHLIHDMQVRTDVILDYEIMTAIIEKEPKPKGI